MKTIPVHELPRRAQDLAEHLGIIDDESLVAVTDTGVCVLAPDPIEYSADGPWWYPSIAIMDNLVQLIDKPWKSRFIQGSFVDVARRARNQLDKSIDTCAVVNHVYAAVIFLACRNYQRFGTPEHAQKRHARIMRLKLSTLALWRLGEPAEHVYNCHHCNHSGRVNFRDDVPTYCGYCQKPIEDKEVFYG